MSTAFDTRPRPDYLRSAAHRTGGRAEAVRRHEPRTLGPSPTVAEFAAAVRRLFRDRAGRLDELADAIRASRYPDRCVNVLVDEAVCRGGPDGLDWAAGVLAQVPPGVLLGVIDSYFRRDAARRRADRQLAHLRYRTADEAWAVLLDALGRIDPAAVNTTAVLATLRRVVRSATDGMAEGLAVAATRLADRRPADKPRAVAFVRRLLDPLPGGRVFGETARGIVQGYLADLSD